jgi:hypothetical protein
MEDLQPETPPSPDSLAEHFQQERLRGDPPMARLTFYACTTQPDFVAWLDMHLSGPIGLWGPAGTPPSGPSRQPPQRRYFGVLALRQVYLLAEDMSQPLTSPAHWQPFLGFSFLPCGDRRMEIVVECSTSPDLRPAILSLFRDITQAWPETAGTLAPFITSGPAAPSKPTPAKLPHVPTRPGVFDRWRLVWKAIRPWYEEEGLSYIGISERLRHHKLQIKYSPDVIEDIILAGRAGLLD